MKLSLEPHRLHRSSCFLLSFSYQYHSDFRGTMSSCATFIWSLQLQLNRRFPGVSTRCVSSRGSEPSPGTGNGNNDLQIGSPIILVEAPPTLKTAGSMPSLRVNSGQVKPGDVGRIVSRKPKDVWAVRLAIGTYLIDGKHFKPLDVDEK